MHDSNALYFDSESFEPVSARVCTYTGAQLNLMAYFYFQVYALTGAKDSESNSSIYTHTNPALARNCCIRYTTREHALSHSTAWDTDWAPFSSNTSTRETKNHVLWMSRAFYIWSDCHLFSKIC